MPRGPRRGGAAAPHKAGPLRRLAAWAAGGSAPPTAEIDHLTSGRCCGVAAACALIGDGPKDAGGGEERQRQHHDSEGGEIAKKTVVLGILDNVGAVGKP